MYFILKPIYKHAKLFMIVAFALTLLLVGLLLRKNIKQHTSTKIVGDPKHIECEHMINETAIEPGKTRRKEYLYRLLTNTTRSLIQMEIKARRLEENMRRIKEKTADLLWKNKDKALWHILFKNISRHISIRHEFHQYSSLKRILQDTNSHMHKHKFGRRRVITRKH
ncbi:unnamed protein product [Euphydryas editha]|uniref:Uncharacterized protein n=1 Tax=Euphydryas editha TaxID=104508 RepID=A0AAU9TY63_EUPED|nr:unnamed protein product [Euphydryas editha]